MSSDVIEHIYDPLEFLKTAFALLRPGGTAVIGTPYHGYLKNVAISLTGKWDVASQRALARRPHQVLQRAVAARTCCVHAGFSEPRFEYYGRFPGFWKNMIAVTAKPDPRMDFSFCPVLDELIRTQRSVGQSGRVFEQLGALSTINNLQVLRAMMLERRPVRTLEVGLGYGGSALAIARHPS